MDEAISQMKNAIISGRTDVINQVLESCNKLGTQGQALREKILSEPTIAEGSFLHLATKSGMQDVVRTFLIAGANPLVENKDGENPFDLATSDVIQQVYVEELLRATASSNLQRMEQLIKAGIDPNSWDCDEKRNSVLHWAVSFGNAETVQFLIDHGAEVNCETQDGVTPLHDAVDRGDIKIIEILLQNNASPLIKAERGKFNDQSSLDLASKKPEVFSLMSQYLAAQFKMKGKRSSMDSVFAGPAPLDSPFISKETLRSPLSDPHQSSGDYVPVYHGFNASLESAVRGLEAKAPIAPIITDTSLGMLWPQPKSLQQLEGLHFRPDKVLYVSVVRTQEKVHKILDVISIHRDVFEGLGFDVVAQQVETFVSSTNQSSCSHSNLLQCCISPDILPNDQSYRLHVSSQKVMITAASLQSLHYAVCTFLQLLTIYAKKDDATAIPPLIINDGPSLNHRAIFIDVSQERIPSIDSLFEHIKTFALLKINHLHLNIRLDKAGSLISYSKGEIVAIDRHCLDCGITLVPVVDITTGITSAEYFQYIRPAFEELLPCFASSKYIHVGPVLTNLMFLPDATSLDQGKDFRRVYNFLPVATPTETIIMLCYNALKMHIGSSSFLATIPANIVLVEYGFQADYNFGPSLQELTQNGCNTCVCAGTSAWNSLAGCPEASLCNIYHGTLNAINSCSMGFIVANWSGTCNLTPKPFAWPGFLLGSGLSWNHQTHWEYLQGSLASLISLYALRDPSGISGQVVLQLGCSESSLLRAATNQPPNDMGNLPPADGTTLYRLLTDPDTVTFDFLTTESFVKCIRSVKKCQTSLFVDSKMPRPDNPVFDELCLTMELMLLACRIGRSLLAAGMNPRSNMGLNVVNLGISNLDARVRTDIANKLLLLTDEYRRVWLLRNYPQGMETSLYALTAVLQRFIPDSSRLLTGRLYSSSYLNGEPNGHISPGESS